MMRYSLQRSFISEMEGAPFKCLFWNASDTVVKLEDVFLKYTDLVIIICYIMTTTTNAKKLTAI